MKLSILIPSLGEKEYLKLFIDSAIRNSKYCDISFHIWDNTEDCSLKDFESCYPQEDIFVHGGGKNVGLSFPYLKMAFASKADVLFFADEDMVPAPGWDIAAKYALENDTWCSPNQVEPCRSSRSILANYGSIYSDFNADFFEHFNHHIYHRHIHKASFYPMFIPRSNYQQIGGHDPVLFLGELDFVWRAFKYYKVRQSSQLTHPNSFIYHFRHSPERGIRSPDYHINLLKDTAAFREKHSITPEEADSIMEHYEVYRTIQRQKSN